jgi:hypothetical protein
LPPISVQWVDQRGRVGRDDDCYRSGRLAGMPRGGEGGRPAWALRLVEGDEEQPGRQAGSLIDLGDVGQDTQHNGKDSEAGDVG